MPTSAWLKMKLMTCSKRSKIACKSGAKAARQCAIEVDSAMPNQIRQMLQEELEVTDRDVYEVNGMLGLGNLMSFLALPDF